MIPSQKEVYHRNVALLDPLEPIEHIDPHSKHRYKKRSGTHKREDRGANAKRTEQNVGLRAFGAQAVAFLNLGHF